MPLDRDDAVTAEVRRIAEGLTHLEGPMLPLLHAVQHSFGYIPAAALPVIADVLNVTAAEVHGVVSFYHDFRTAPAGRVTVRICRSEACKATGGDALAAEVSAKLGIEMGETSADGAVTLAPVYCLGLCACGPAALVGDRLIGRATAAGLVEAMR